MGGFNSGRKRNRKTTLEDSWVLAAHEVVPKLGVGASAGPLSLIISYEVPLSGLPMSCSVTAEPSRPFFGGQRWWWRCACGARVSALFLPAVCATELRCRHCHNLAYRSTQRHDSRVDYYRKHPEAASHVLRVSPLNVARLFLVLRSSGLIGERGGVKAARPVAPLVGAS